MRLALGVSVALILSIGTPVNAGDSGPRDVHPSLRPDLIAFYDFDHPMPGDPALERDQGRSSTEIELINGGAAARVADAAYPGARRALQTKQVSAGLSNDDWKAGIYSPAGVRTLRAFNATSGTTVLGWFKRSMDGPALNTVTADPADRFSAIGLAGILTGTSEGHAVRALIELIDVDGTLRLAALGRRLDTGASQIFAATADWRVLLPEDQWVHLAATFDFTTGTLALYRNGMPIEGVNAVAGDPWEVSGPGPHVTSATDPRGIKIGGSFPQNTVERNPCDCRMDALMFLDRSLSARDVANQYRFFKTRG